MKKAFKLISLLAFSSVALTGCNFITIEDNSGQQEEDKGGEQGGEQQGGEQKIYDEEKQAARIAEYYAEIDSSQSGTTLLSSLRTLNLKMRKSQVGYSAMSTSSSGMFKWTDYDPSSVKFNSDGIPYGTRILSFYSGKSTTTFNREHTWPKSRDGNLVENDIFMTRPTINEENSDRGNSVYVTGMVSQSNGWDPVAAFQNNIGVYESIRGECARIIFYCMTASDSLILNDNTNNAGNNMGKITDLIKWACENPVNEREKRRNVGGEYLQGNRNAFVDHPEYACKIWGSYNSSTKSACQKANYATN
jgi:endonuclease I